jgi:hypothetical protein
MKLVTVVWHDAVGADGWIDIKDLEKEVPVVHHSVGYVVKDTDEFITITMSYDEAKESLGAWLLIPKKFIISLTEIK